MSVWLYHITLYKLYLEWLCRTRVSNPNWPKALTPAKMCWTISKADRWRCQNWADLINLEISNPNNSDWWNKIIKWTSCLLSSRNTGTSNSRLFITPITVPTSFPKTLRGKRREKVDRRILYIDWIGKKRKRRRRKRE